MPDNNAFFSYKCNYSIPTKMIVGIIGKMGSGKTLTMTLLAYIMQQSGKNIRTNFNINFPHQIMTKADITNYGKGQGQEIQNTVLCLDEVQTILDCRTSNKNRVMTYFILQTRKRGVDILYTSQQFFNVEKRLRENTNILLECTPVKKEGTKTLEYIHIDVIEYHGREIFSPIKTINLKVSDKIYKLYDTYQIINYDSE
jgi:ABC-type uncharacterized transport system ATPase subunit